MGSLRWLVIGVVGLGGFLLGACGGICVSSSQCAANQVCSGGTCSTLQTSDAEPIDITGSGDSSSSSGACTNLPHKRLPVPPPVVNGTRAPTLVPLDGAQQNAVVGWRAPVLGSRSFCSGTLIASTFVLTAAHCTEVLTLVRLEETEVVFGQDDSLPQLALHPTRMHQHATQDMVILELPQVPSTVNVRPISIAVDNLTVTDVGQQVEAAGYGLTDPVTQEQSGRFFVMLSMTTLATVTGLWPNPLDAIEVYGNEQRGVCNGDSGGPLLRTSPRTGDARVLGVAHAGERTCTGRDYYNRVDVHRSWIEGIVGTTPGGGTTSCGSVTSQGSCNAGATVATWCNNGVVQRDTCPPGEQCTVTSAGARCRSVPVSCGSITAFGECDSGTLKWCSNGQLLSRPCTQCGEVCQLVDTTTGYDCVVVNP